MKPPLSLGLLLMKPSLERALFSDMRKMVSKLSKWFFLIAKKGNAGAGITVEIGKERRISAGLIAVQDLLFFICTFVLIQKYQKIKTANKSLKFYSITLQKKNSSGRNRTQTAFSVYAPLRKIY